MVKGKIIKPLTEAEYQNLAEFRYQLRRFVRYMEERAREIGINPQQYQVLLAVKGMPRGQVPTISSVAERMQLNHNSMVELIDRCEDRGLLRRTRSSSDRRQVMLAITPEGEQVMRQQASASRQELLSIGPILVQSLQGLLQAEPAAKPGKEGAVSRTKKTKESKKRGL